MPKYKIYAGVLKCGDIYMSCGFKNSVKLTYRGKFECKNDESAENLGFYLAETDYFLHAIEDDSPFMTMSDWMKVYPNSLEEAQRHYIQEVKNWTGVKIKKVKEINIKKNLYNHYIKLKNIFQTSSSS